MRGYSSTRKGLFSRILAGAVLVGASYLGSTTSLEQRALAAEPSDVVAVQQNFGGRTPKNEREAIEQMYSYAFDNDNWAKIVDLGRDNANGYFASLMNDKSAGRITAAFNSLKKEYLAKAKTYSEVFGREIDQPFITWTESMLKKVKDNQLKTYLLINVVDTTQSLEEFTRRVKELETRDPELATQYKLAEKKLNLRLVPGGVEYWFGTIDGKVGVDKLIKELPSSAKPDQVYSQVPGSSWKTREESILAGAFELIDPEKNVLPIRDLSFNDLKNKVKEIANRQGFTEKDLVSILREEEWEQGARGSKTKRYSIYGNLDHLKTIAELNGFKELNTQLFYLQDSGRKFLSEGELMRKTPLDRSPYGLIGMVGNSGEITEGEAKREMNTTPSDDERTAYNLVSRYEGAIEKGGVLQWNVHLPFIWDVSISSRAIINRAGVPAAGGYYDSTRMRVAFPKKLKEATSTPIAPPNPPETRVVDPNSPK